MELRLKRIARKPTYTIGKLYVDGKYCADTLEDTDRGLNTSMSLHEIYSKKIKDKTAIPTGTYNITLNVVSPKYSNYKKYPWAKQYGGKLPRLMAVPGYDGILIHCGNTPEHTSGCILLGENKVVGKVINSTATFHRFMELIKDQKDLKITIQ